MSGSAQEGCRAAHRSSEPWGPSPRPRSHSLTSADARWLHQRTVRFLISDSDDEDEDGYCEDNEGSSSEDAFHRIRNRERPRGEHTHHHSCVNYCKPESPHSRRRSAPALRECRQTLRASEQQRSQLELLKKSSRKRERSLNGRNFPQSSAPAHPSSCRLQQQQKQRPSSAGALVKSRRQVRPWCPRRLNFCHVSLRSASPSLVTRSSGRAPNADFSLTLQQNCFQLSARRRENFWRPSQKRDTLYAQPSGLCRRAATAAQRR